MGKNINYMKTYNVVWTERHAVNIEAETEEEAIEKACQCDYDEAGLSAEIDSMPEAYEINLK